MTEITVSESVSTYENILSDRAVARSVEMVQSRQIELTCGLNFTWQRRFDGCISLNLKLNRNLGIPQLNLIGDHVVIG
jgi:hypothetical protein